MKSQKHADSCIIVWEINHQNLIFKPLDLFIIILVDPSGIHEQSRELTTHAVKAESCSWLTLSDFMPVMLEHWQGFMQIFLVGVEIYIVASNFS